MRRLLRLIKVVLATSYRAPWRRGADRGRGRVGQGSRLGTCYTDDYGSVPGYHEAEQHGKLTTCEAELQQPDAQRSLGDGRAQGMMHVVTQHMPHAVRASAGVTSETAGHLQLVPARPGAYFRLMCDKDFSRAQPAPTSGQGVLGGPQPRLKPCAALPSGYECSLSRTSDPCRSALLSVERRSDPLPASRWRGCSGALAGMAGAACGEGI